MLSVPSSTVGCVVAVLRETGAEDGAEVPFVRELAHSGATPHARGHGGRARTLVPLLDAPGPEPRAQG